MGMILKSHMCKVFLECRLHLNLLQIVDSIFCDLLVDVDTLVLKLAVHLSNSSPWLIENICHLLHLIWSLST